MYLSNDMYQDGVCNGTVGIVTHVDADSKSSEWRSLASVMKPLLMPILH